MADAPFRELGRKKNIVAVRLADFTFKNIFHIWPCLSDDVVVSVV